MRLWLTIVTLGILLLFALRHGGGPERAVAKTLALALALGFSRRLLFGPTSYLDFNWAQFAIEIGVLVGLTNVAIRANRWWPLCASALQVLVVFTYLCKLVGIKSMAGVYWGMTTLPTYLQYLVLLAGIYGHSRRVSRVGQYPDWRIA